MVLLENLGVLEVWVSKRKMTIQGKSGAGKYQAWKRCSNLYMSSHKTDEKRLPPRLQQ